MARAAEAARAASRAGTAWSACANGSRSTAASSKWAHGRKAGSRSASGYRSPSSARARPTCQASEQRMTEPVSGTFTFLLTDIEGSTLLVRRLRENYGDVLAQHHLLLRTAFEEAGGQGIGLQGDAVFVAFR